MAQAQGISDRKADLAKIHIARKDLGLDDDTYRQIIREIGKAPSGSAADLSTAGRLAVLRHFKEHGWKAKRKPGRRRQPGEPASNDQVQLIKHIWWCLVAAGAVKSREEAALRRWLRNATKRYHPQRAGYDDPRFLPKEAAVHAIEQLKNWATRCEIKWQ